MGKTKILQIVPGYEFPISDVANHYANFFDNTRYEVTTLYLSGSEKLQIAADDSVSEVLSWQLKSSGLGFFDFKCFFRLYRLIKTKGFTVVICHSYPLLFMAILIRQLFLRFNLVGIINRLGGVSKMEKYFLSLMETNQLLLLGVSDKVRDDIRSTLEGLPPDQIQTSYPGLDYKKLKAGQLSKSEARHRFGLNEEDYLFVNVEALTVKGNQKSLIQGFGRVINECSRAKLVFMGDGEAKNPLKKLVKQLLLKDRVIFKHIDDFWGTYLKAFDAIIWSSDTEAFNPLLLEAMASGIPIIATDDSGGAFEVMADTAAFFKKNDVNQLIYKMRQVYNLDRDNKLALKIRTYSRLKHHFRAEACSKIFWNFPIARDL